MGGAQAIAALAYGTESVRAGGRDRRARATPTCRRPSARWPARWASTASPGPSELVVVAAAGADPELVALDLLAQAEHGADSLLWCISPDAGCCDAVVDAVERLRRSGRACATPSSR